MTLNCHSIVCMLAAGVYGPQPAPFDLSSYQIFCLAEFILQERHSPLWSEGTKLA